MKNIYILPTDKPSRLVLDDTIQQLKLINKGEALWGNKNIHITSDEEIKEGDYVYHKILKSVFKIDLKEVTQEYIDEKINISKIILTTDQDLIKDGVQAIDDEFLEWFVKNPSCERVDFTKIYLSNNGQWKDVLLPSEWEADTIVAYRIIIPKEEPKLEIPNPINNIREKVEELRKQETLEEVARAKHRELSTAEIGIIPNFTDGFVEGAKWQAERMYTELFEWLATKDYLSDKVDVIQKEFEQFKKK